MRFKRIILFLVLSLLLCESSFLCEGYEDLKNIGSKFEVIIEELARKDDVKTIGLTKERLRTVAELRLRKEGMTIVDKASLEIPIVYVSVIVVGLAYDINFLICEWAELRRLPFTKGILATIWAEGATGTHGDDSEEIVSGLNTLFDEFFNEYYKANPKEKKKMRT